MNSNVRIARELVRLAKRIVAGAVIDIDRAKLLVEQVLKENGLDGTVFKDNGNLCCRINLEISPDSPSIPPAIRESIVYHAGGNSPLDWYDDESDIDGAGGVDTSVDIKGKIDSAMSKCSIVWCVFTFDGNGGIHLKMTLRYIDGFGKSVDAHSVESDYKSSAYDESEDESNFKYWLNETLDKSRMGI